MPRKKSVGGRKRTDLTTNYLLERANKKLVNLERANLSDKYASRELIRSLQGHKAVKVGSRKARNRIKVITHDQKMEMQEGEVEDERNN